MLVAYQPPEYTFNHSTCRAATRICMQTGDGRFRCIVTQKRTPFVIGTFDTGGALALRPVHFGLPLRLPNAGHD